MTPLQRVIGGDLLGSAVMSASGPDIVVQQRTLTARWARLLGARRTTQAFVSGVCVGRALVIFGGTDAAWSRIAARRMRAVLVERGFSVAWQARLRHTLIRTILSNTGDGWLIICESIDTEAFERVVPSRNVSAA